MELNFKNGIAAAFAAGLSFASMQAAAEGFYIGAGVGEASLQAKDSFDFDGDEIGIDFDESDTGYKIFGGYSFGFFGVEVAYLDLGAPDDNETFVIGGTTYTAGIEAEATAFTLEGVGTLPLGPVDLFAKVGVISYDADLDVGATDGEVTEFFSGGDEGEELAYGVGATLNLGQFGIRAEYQLFDIADDVELISLSAVLNF